MILGTLAIKQALRVGDITCIPPPSRIEGAHIDVTLGRYYWLMRRYTPARTLRPQTDDPRPWFDLYDARSDIENGEIIIPGHSFALCHTQEFVGDVNGRYVPMLETRSTLARWGIAVHAGAGMGDPFFHSRWTLEIWNHNVYPVALPVGARVGGIAFHAVEGEAEHYEGRYNIGPDEWTPECMLPRMGNLL